MARISLHSNNSVISYFGDTENNVTLSMYDHEPSPRSEELRILRTLHWIFSSIIGVIFVALGITGNTLSFIVWRKRSLQSSTGHYLTFLSFVDMFVLILYFLVESLPQIEPLLRFSPNYGAFYSYVGYPCFHFASMVSLWFMFGATFDRYIHVCCPSKAKLWCKKRKVNLILCLTSGICFFFTIPHFLTYVPNEESFYSFVYTEFGNSDMKKKYIFWVFCFLLMNLAWYPPMFMNFRMVRHLKTTKISKPQAKLTRMLLYVSFASLLFLTLGCSPQCYLMFFRMNDIAIFEEAWSLTLLVVVIRSSVNIVFYALFYDRFCRELKKVFGWLHEQVFEDDVTSHEESTE
ncbi:FMRFamide peptide receptor frpr-18-like [Saccostrea echinata]|uniref:FMRFamide peptide receptor frpr-18-like n=1 Tax=Saccostrea echinata TaxID=191078 RepID=UPI002A7FC161|nr:FMRFamide peptide receptor frpr-18-like [Saccostrea echinata]